MKAIASTAFNLPLFTVNGWTFAVQRRKHWFNLNYFGPFETTVFLVSKHTINNVRNIRPQNAQVPENI